MLEQQLQWEFVLTIPNNFLFNFVVKMTTLLLEEKVKDQKRETSKIPESDVIISPSYAERIARRFGINLKKAGLPNYSDNDEDPCSYLRWFTNLKIETVAIDKKRKRVLTGTYFVKAFMPTLDSRVISLEPESFYFMAE